MTTAAEALVLVPKLRFPGFRDEWEWTALGECLDYQQPTDYLVSATNYSNSYSVPVLTAGKTFILGYTNETHGVFSEGLPVIIFDDFTTATQFVDFPFKAKSSAMKILQARGGANIKFMYELMRMIAYEVGAHERHWISKFAPMLVLVPQTEEQQKIADCLASIDELITLESQRLDHLKLYKKGLMQQLFPAEGETVPRLRFPEFRDAGEWELVSLNKIARRCTQKNRSGAITRVLTNSAEYGVVDQRDYFDKDIATQDNLEKYYIVEKGDYVYNPRISAAAPVGPISKNNVATGVMSPLYSVFRFGDDNNDFYAHYFKTTGWHQYMRQASSTGARHDRMAITNDDFMAMPLPISTLEEQQKIADCLASIDELITLESQRLDHLKLCKKGLMQQLFPVPDGFSAAQAGNT